MFCLYDPVYCVCTVPERPVVTFICYSGHTNIQDDGGGDGDNVDNNGKDVHRWNTMVMPRILVN